MFNVFNTAVGIIGLGCLNELIIIFLDIFSDKTCGITANNKHNDYIYMYIILYYTVAAFNCIFIVDNLSIENF